MREDLYAERIALAMIPGLERKRQSGARLFFLTCLSQLLPAACSASVPRPDENKTVQRAWFLLYILRRLRSALRASTWALILNAGVQMAMGMSAQSAQCQRLCHKKSRRYRGDARGACSTTPEIAEGELFVEMI